MNVKIDWENPFGLKPNRLGDGYDDRFLNDVPDGAGVYIFARKYGRSVTPIYVGRATSLRTRIKQQLNNRKLISAVRNFGASNAGDAPLAGARLLYVGCLAPNPGMQKTPARLALAEKALIEHALTEGHPIINIKGTQIRHHKVESRGSAYEQGLVPEEILQRMR